MTVRCLDEAAAIELLMATDGVVLLAFGFPGLRATSALDVTLAALAEEFRDSAVIARVLLDEKSTIGKAYGVDALPTAILFRGGVEIGRLEGLKPPHNYVIALESALLAPPGADGIRYLDTG